MLTALELTEKLIRFNTINPPGDEMDCADYIGKILENEGFSVSYFNFAPKRTSLIAKYGTSSNQAPLCLTGHIDVVPLGGKQWRHSPFDCEKESGKLYGRGSSDMKSGIAAIVLAAIKVKKKSNLTLVITAGEEICCQGANHLVEQEGALGTAGAIVVGEPTANQAWLGHKGILWLECTSFGTTAHGSMPHLGDNAIFKSMDEINKIKNFDFKGFEHPLLGKPCLNIGTISGGLNT
ncbi:MAG: M20 family metallopeptidase, partial [Proteobacteria bacterium]|nr:M20 family metallopeptidase [Pseudomonadota bacterium]